MGGPPVWGALSVPSAPVTRILGGSCSLGVIGDWDSKLGCEGPVVMPSSSSESLASYFLTLPASSPNMPAACLGSMTGRLISTTRGFS